jgi:2-dehydro-3-deoxygluconokinase
MSTVVCFGELLLRLGAPGREALLQTPRLEVHVGGAEANVAVALARFGHATRVVSVLPDDALGDAARDELRRHGVDTRAIARGGGRMGLYFLATGALQRPSQVLYDRADSAFARARSEAFDWPALLAGATHLHLSGVTPALGAEPAATALQAARAARAAGLSVSFDGNYRSTLWQRWDGDAPALLRALFAEAELIFADHRDLQVVLGLQFAQLSPAERFAAAAAAAFDAFPRLQRFAATAREQRSVDHHALSAFLATRAGALHATPACELLPIVDRIGAGDAFAAGVLHGVLGGRADVDSLRFGWGAACLKHSIPGDFALLDAAQVEAFVAQERLDVRR